MAQEMSKKTLLIVLLVVALLASVYVNFHTYNELEQANRNVSFLQRECARLQNENDAYKAALVEIQRKAEQSQLSDLLKVLLGLGF